MTLEKQVIFFATQETGCPENYHDTPSTSESEPRVCQVVSFFWGLGPTTCTYYCLVLGFLQGVWMRLATLTHTPYEKPTNQEIVHGPRWKLNDTVNQHISVNSPMQATCSVQLPLLNLIIQEIIVEEYKPRRSIATNSTTQLIFFVRFLCGVRADLNTKTQTPDISITQQCVNHSTAVITYIHAITSMKSPSFYMTTFNASLANLTAVLPQSRDYSCYVSRPILAPPPL